MELIIGLSDAMVCELAVEDICAGFRGGNGGNFTSELAVLD